MHDHQPGTIGEAESGADVAEQDDRNPDFEPEVVGGEAGRVDGMKVFERKHVGLCLVSHPVGGGVDKLFSGKGRHSMGIQGIHVFVPGSEDAALDKVGMLSVGNVVERAINASMRRRGSLSSSLGASINGEMTTSPPDLLRFCPFMISSRCCSACWESMM